MSIDAYLIATTAEADAAYISLNDIVSVLAKRPRTRVIGGHMVSLITAAFPTQGLIARRTGDADAGIPIELAAPGEIPTELLAADYEAESGNRYVKKDYDDPKPTIDILVPC